MEIRHCSHRVCQCQRQRQRETNRSGPQCCKWSRNKGIIPSSTYSSWSVSVVGIDHVQCFSGVRNIQAQEDVSGEETGAGIEIGWSWKVAEAGCTHSLMANPECIQRGSAERWPKQRALRSNEWRESLVRIIPLISTNAAPISPALNFSWLNLHEIFISRQFLPFVQKTVHQDRYPSHGFSTCWSCYDGELCGLLANQLLNDCWWKLDAACILIFNCIAMELRLVCVALSRFCSINRERGKGSYSIWR
jgi:hypothetical protein